MLLPCYSGSFSDGVIEELSAHWGLGSVTHSVVDGLKVCQKPFSFGQSVAVQLSCRRRLGSVAAGTVVWMKAAAEGISARALELRHC